MSEEKYPPDAVLTVHDGKLVRVCPECRERVGEQTAADGTVSDHYGDHYREAHPPEPDPELAYALSGKATGHRFADLTDLDYSGLRSIQRQFPEPRWQMVDRIEDVPEGALALSVREAMAAMLGGEPWQKEVRWYRRTGDKLTFQPTKKQAARFSELGDRIMAAMNESLAIMEAIDVKAEGSGYLFGCEEKLCKVMEATLKLLIEKHKSGDRDWTKIEAALDEWPEKRAEVHKRLADEGVALPLAREAIA
jgi:hypothetical protein